MNLTPCQIRRSSTSTIRETNFDSEIWSIHGGEALGEDVSNEDVFYFGGPSFRH